MTIDPRRTPIQHLEVSVRTAALLRDLGVTTVEDLLALPSVTLPRLSMFELLAIFADLGVTYEGTWDVQEAPDLLRADGDVETRWQTILSWLGEQHPEELGRWRDGATEAELQAAEAELGRALPEDYRRFLRIHDGQSSGGVWTWSSTMWPIAVVATRYREVAKLMGDASWATEQPAEIRSVGWSDGWIPIAVTPRGRDFICLDLDPGPAGAVGQVIVVSVDADEHELLASSFTELLSVFFEEAQSGELYFD